MKNLIYMLCMLFIQQTHAQNYGFEQPVDTCEVIIKPHMWKSITLDDVIQKTKIYFSVYNNNMYWVIILPRCNDEIPEDLYPEESNFFTSFILKKDETILKKITGISKCKIIWSLPRSSDRGDYQIFRILGIDSEGREHILYVD